MNWIKNKISHFYNALDGKGLYQFGAVLVLIFLGIYSYTDFPYQWVTLLLFILQVIGFKFHQILRIEYTLLSMLTYPIGAMVSMLAMIVIYAFIITPIGFFRKRNYIPKWTESFKGNDTSKMYE